MSKREPLLRLAEHHRRLLAVEHVAPDGLAPHRLAVGLRHGQRARVELAGDLQLVERALPLAAHAQQLKEKYAQGGIGRPGAHLLLQEGQGRRGITVLETERGGVGCAHGPRRGYFDSCFLRS